jgi:hypothetical protein
VSEVSSAQAAAGSRVISLRTLHEETLRVFRELAETGQPLCITHHGRFVAIIKPLDDWTVVGEAIETLIASGAFGNPNAPVTHTFTLEEAADELGVTLSDTSS